MPTKQPQDDDPTVPEKRLLTEFANPDYDQWRDEVTRLLRGAPYEKRMLTKTHEGITLKPLYIGADIKDLPFVTSRPGFAPFVRGFQPVHQRDGWTIAQKINYPTPEEFNKAVIYDLERGQSAVNLNLDRASRFGLDPQSAEPGQVGGDGVSISSAADMIRAFEGVNFEKTPVYLQTGVVGLPYLAFYLAAAEKSNVPTVELKGAVAMDPLGELVETGDLPLSLDGTFADMAAMTAWAVEKAPSLGTVWVHGETYHNGGGNAVSELAFVIATAVEYLRQMETREIKLEQAVSHFRFSFAQGSNFFMELAKLRAARLLWNRVQESCEIPEDKRFMWLHVENARYNKTVFDPYVNILRLTTETFSGIAGGADSVNVIPFDERLKPAGEFSRRVSRNIQIILKDEVKLAKITDPAGGSRYVERLTAEIAQAAWTLFQKVEEKGGMAKALQLGFPQEEIDASAKKRAEAFSSRKDIMIGNNKYPNPTEKLEPATLPDYRAIRENRVKQLERYKTAFKDTDKYLAKLTDTEALVPAVFDAARHGATVGEIIKARYSDMKEKISVTPIKIRYTAEPLEKLRQAVEIHSKNNDLKVFLATLGPVGRYMARLDFAASFFEVGGFNVERTAGFDTPEQAAEKALEAKAAVVAICGPDEAYVEKAQVTAALVKKDNPDAIVILAGQPAPEVIERLRAAGVDLFIHVKSDILEVLSEVALKSGVSL